MCCGKLVACLLCYGKLGSLARYLSLLPQLLLNETHPIMSWWTQAYLIPCKGRHLLQEGFGLSYSTILHGGGTGRDLVSPKAGSHK